MSRIRLLCETTVNRIAAGEVIERPAAATKELVENALDAGATRIAVCLDGGGIDRLEVTDNGTGMSAEELGLCVMRHATSKLTDDNLVRITTLGFRGEALPSIGAAARLQITSRPPGAEHANVITVEGGAVTAVAPAAGAPGTRVVVRDLFFATPARRKFLKSPRIEAEHAEAAVRRLALAAPQVTFRLQLDGRLAFEALAQPRIERVAALVGPEAAGVLLPVEQERDGLRLSGYVCAPSVTRATPAAQTLIVNHRPVADPVLRTAVRVAFRDVIAAGRHAIVALYLDIPPGELDVNVHPAKTELRFRDAGLVRSMLIGGVRRALAAASGPAVAAPAFSIPWPMSRARPARIIYPPAHPPSQTAPPLSLSAGSSPAVGLAEARLPLQAPPAARHTAALPTGAHHQIDAQQTGALAPSPDHLLGAPVAQLLDTYIIAVAADGALVLVDQHAAHERLTHEAIRDQMLAGAVRSQPLLLPAVVDLPAADAARLLARADDFSRLGLEIEGFGPGAILVRALPAVLEASEPGPLLRDLADELSEMDEQTVLSARLDAVIARMACHGSIRAGRRLGQAEMSALLRQMEQTPRAATCSHGRPTVLKLTKTDIEKMFGRR